MLTISELEDAVERDTETSRIKELAVLLISAMRDWPTFNQVLINDFVREAKAYFGNPLTIKQIESKEFILEEELSAWRAEAGSALAEMIDISSRFENEDNFDRIIENILKKYKEK
ncbi:hypothetical protein [Adhaeribacter aerolatus]|nr:hypothetical protein [Adhaeribacter aerolatus]